MILNVGMQRGTNPMRQIEENVGFGSFEQAFKKLTGHDRPHDWQKILASRTGCRSMTIRIPTGMGKTEGIMAAWIWKQLSRDDDCSVWPRRLVWCLPMRVLVEQTLDVAKYMINRLTEDIRPDVVPIMGGLDCVEWFLHPERTAIIIGTQDMLLSRALNRGYGSGRARWPVEYGLLHNDALWIMDEIQLMDVGLATSAQLQAYRDQEQASRLRPCHTWWMSATLQADWLHTVDTADRHAEWACDPIVISEKDKANGLWKVKKSVDRQEFGTNKEDVADFAKKIAEEHSEITKGQQGCTTLVVCNTVDRAVETYEALRSIRPEKDLELIHSRFRPQERTHWRADFLNRAACERGDADRIIVATQVIEAGVDISANCLITELAPWPSLVQRFGRCARYGGSGRVLVVKRGDDEKIALPYSPEELEHAWQALENIGDVGIGTLEEYEASLKDKDKERLYPYEPEHLLLRREYDELLDTTPDLTGADMDISRFIRSGDERDLQVFWCEVPTDQPQCKENQPRRDELCPVPFLKARDWLCEPNQPRLRKSRRAWVWNWLDGEWKSATRDILLPGRIVCVDAQCGGYSEERGFSPESSEPVPLLPDHASDKPQVDRSDAQHDSDALSESAWKTIACHSREVCETVEAIASAVELPRELINLLKLAAQWHDAGKAHPVFQGVIRGNNRPDRQDLAKAPEGAWLRPLGTYRTGDDRDSRPGFRHELASVLALFAVLERYKPDHPALLGPWTEVFEAMGSSITAGLKDPTVQPTALEKAILDLDAKQFDLLAYLVASHHGKVRAALHASPKDQDYVDQDGRGLPIRGLREGDTIPSITLETEESPLPELAMTLEPAKLGLSPRTGPSWRERTLGLLNRHGPGSLAYMEAILRAADVRASRLNTSDPALETEVAR